MRIRYNLDPDDNSDTLYIDGKRSWHEMSACT